MDKTLFVNKLIIKVYKTNEISRFIYFNFAIHLPCLKRYGQVHSLGVDLEETLSYFDVTGKCLNRFSFAYGIIH